MASGPGESFDAGLSGAVPADAPLGAGRVDPRARGSLRSLAAKGIVVNTIFLVAINALGFVKGFGVAAFLTPADYGLWGLLAVSFTTLFKLVQVGVDDKYIQQDEEDQELAFQEAFTMQCLLCGAFFVVIALAMPLFALAYDEPKILLPGYALALVVPAMALQSPLWAYYRNMDFVTQRKLQSFDPVVGLVVTIGMAAAGLGYWSLIGGVVIGGWVAAIVAMRNSPFPLKVKFRRGTLREYWGFSGPLFYAALIVIVIGQVPVLVGKHAIGLLGVGAMGLANNISQYATRVDDVVTNTLYPAICAVKDRTDLMLESFTKSNRLALLWAAPLGTGMALFAPDFVAHVLGHKWDLATYAIQAFGVAAAINQIGFNWSAFYRAIGDTRPIAINTAVMCAGVLAIAIPLLLADGIDGYATGMGLATIVLVVNRLRYLVKLFPLRAILVNTAMGIMPSLPALAAVLALRLATWGGARTTLQALAEMVLFGVVVALVTLRSERTLLHEFRGYLAGRGAGIRSALEPEQV
ncbi:MAG: lipopolysaccharide biosynthesis protein [Solirubrobacterales bacterium]|nr:lipopolysaccharide biosynthesis protein [Solirubrobacterales bacterium]